MEVKYGHGYSGAPHISKIFVERTFLFMQCLKTQDTILLIYTGLCSAYGCDTSPTEILTSLFLGTMCHRATFKIDSMAKSCDKPLKIVDVFLISKHKELHI